MWEADAQRTQLESSTSANGSLRARSRCGAMHDLQIDHIQPYAHGCTHDPENLRVLCGAHNRWRAEKEFGASRLPVRK